MTEIDGINGNGNHGGVVLDIKDNYPSSSSIKEVFVLNFFVPFMQKGCKIYLLSVQLCLCFLLAI
jgi:aquaporin NIP